MPIIAGEWSEPRRKLCRPRVWTPCPRTKTNLLKVKHIPTPGTNSAPNCTLFGTFISRNPNKMPPMNTLDARDKFVELRAQGWTLAHIATELHYSKRTLVDWNRDLADE